MGNHFFLQGIFLTQGSNTGLLHCRQILYHQGSVVYWAWFIWNTNPAVTGWCSKWYWDVGNKDAVSSSCLLIKRLHWDVRTPTEVLGMWKTLSVYICLPPPLEWLFFLLNVEQVVGENSSAPIYYPALAFQGKEFRGIAKGLDVSSKSELTQQGRYPVVMLGSWRWLVSGTSFTDGETEVLGAQGLPLRWQLSQLLLTCDDDMFLTITQEFSPPSDHKLLEHFFCAEFIFAFSTIQQMLVINPEYSLEGLMPKLQYFGHWMQRADSLEKTLMLGTIEGKRRKGWQRMRWHHWLNGHEFKQTLVVMKDRGAWHAAVHGVVKSWTWLSDWTTTSLHVTSILHRVCEPCMWQIGCFVMTT